MPSEDKPQTDKFRDLARELGCDEDEAAFEGQVRRVAGAPPSLEALERRLYNAQSERDAWKGKAEDRYKAADLLVQGLEKQVRAAASGRETPPHPSGDEDGGVDG